MFITSLTLFKCLSFKWWSCFLQEYFSIFYGFVTFGQTFQHCPKYVCMKTIIFIHDMIFPSQDRSISCSKNQRTMIELVVLSASAFFMIFLGQYLALEGLFGQLSKFENITNLLIFPLIISYWSLGFMIHVCIAMILALSQKFMERLEQVPEKEVDSWIFDNLTLFNTFTQKWSQFCLFVMSAL